jgi:hypothetical protein
MRTPTSLYFLGIRYQLDQTWLFSSLARATNISGPLLDLPSCYRLARQIDKTALVKLLE